MSSFKRTLKVFLLKVEEIGLVLVKQNNSKHKSSSLTVKFKSGRLEQMRKTQVVVLTPVKMKR